MHSQTGNLGIIPSVTYPYRMMSILTVRVFACVSHGEKSRCGVLQLAMIARHMSESHVRW